MTHTLIATTIMGLESVLAKEIQALGYDTEIFNTKVAFKGDDQAICRANLWLRTAGRVYLKIASFKSTAMFFVSFIENVFFVIGSKSFC